jgi:hypothetical protein
MTEPLVRSLTYLDGAADLVGVPGMRQAQLRICTGSWKVEAYRSVNLTDPSGPFSRSRYASPSCVSGGADLNVFDTQHASTPV